jgi:hypothetical protein
MLLPIPSLKFFVFRFCLSPFQSARLPCHPVAARADRPRRSLDSTGGSGGSWRKRTGNCSSWLAIAPKHSSPAADRHGVKSRWLRGPATILICSSRQRANQSHSRQRKSYLGPSGRPSLRSLTGALGYFTDDQIDQHLPEPASAPPIGHLQSAGPRTSRAPWLNIQRPLAGLANYIARQYPRLAGRWRRR